VKPFARPPGLSLGYSNKVVISEVGEEVDCVTGWTASTPLAFPNRVLYCAQN